MESKRSFKATLLALLASGMLFGSPNCVPSRTQINGLINSSLINGVSLAIELAIASTLTPILTPSGDSQ
jgi:hypothetical protein